MNTPACTILAGDVRRSLKRIADKSIHCAVTSPPYWSLRSYLASDHPLKQFELGSEPTPTAFVENLLEVFREVRRVLRDDGSVWVNLGDSYASTGKNRTPAQASAASSLSGGLNSQMQSLIQPSKIVGGLKELDQCLVPHQFAMAMRNDGWYMRDTAIWVKPSAMPISVDGWRWERCRIKTNAQQRGTQGSVQNDGPRRRDMSNGKYVGSAEFKNCPGCEKCIANDGMVLRRGSWRTTTTHEYIFLFTKTDEYFGDRDAVATEAAMTTVERNRYSRVLDDSDEQFSIAHDHEFAGETANLRSVWMISAEPTSEKHYAAYPSALAERCILASTSGGGVCSDCGAPLARIVDRKREYRQTDSGYGQHQNHGTLSNRRCDSHINKTLGWRPTCSCQADVTPAVVLDPFGGTGRTAVAAIRNGRRAVLCELNPASIDISKRVVGAESPLFGGVEVVNECGSDEVLSVKGGGVHG